jgi:glycosyltransferase involved in cell wall biosynthesis
MDKENKVTVSHPFSNFIDRMLRSRAEKIGQVERPNGNGSNCCTDKPIETFSPGVFFEGVFHGWSGYAKASRELAFRLANHLYVQIAHALKRLPWSHFPGVVRLSAMERTYVGETCPLIHFYGPSTEPVAHQKRHKIIYTMMETEIIHPHMVECINKWFDELWTPTQWGADAFKRSGVSIPIEVMPLGVNSMIYRPIKGAKLPECTLLSTSRAGIKEVPEGFIFISVGLDSFRKGFDHLAQAFEKAFAKDKECALVVATTYGSIRGNLIETLRGMKSRVYALYGEYDEHQMARIYSACNAYVTASLGEGWNLPLCEASACGLPVICGDTTCHKEVAGPSAFMFNFEGTGPVPGAESVSPWYDGMSFPIFGKKSLSELVDLLRLVRKNGPKVRSAAADLRRRVVTKWTWDNLAELAAHRLLELQG